MKDIAIKEICRKITEEHGIDISNFVALDFFARAGDWQTKYFAERVQKTFAWEIDEKFEKELKKNLPSNSEVTIGDSFSLCLEKKGFFDMVVLDNPQGCYGANNEHCEHFEALPLALDCLKDEGVIIFNVKVEPFNYEDKELWRYRRNSFYSLSDCSKLEKEFVFDFYESYMRDNGFSVDFNFWTRRPQEPGLFAMTMRVQK